MKRSTNLRLTLMAAALPAAMAGCESPPTGIVLLSKQDCSASAELPVTECEAAYEIARKQHAAVAPRFEDPYQCMSQFGECTPVSEAGATRWLPPMGGFLLGYTLANLGNERERQTYTYSGSLPLYRDYHTREFLKPSGEAIARSTGTVYGSSGKAAPPARAITVSRAGFGSTSSARSSFGG